MLFIWFFIISIVVKIIVVKYLDDWATVSEASKKLDIAPSTVRKYIKEGAFEVLEKSKKDLRPYLMIRSKR